MKSWTSCQTLKGARPHKWMRIPHLDLHFYKFIKPTGLILSVRPADPGESPFDVGVYISDDEIETPIQFLTQR